MNYFWPSRLYEYNEDYYTPRPWFKNELSNNFNVNLFCKVEKINEINKNKYLKLDNEIHCIDFFNETSPAHFLLNYKYYKNLIYQMTSPKTDYYFVHYPYRKTSILLAKILSNFNLTIWVQSDYVGLFGVADESRIRSTGKQILSPVVSNLFPKMTEKIFEDNIIFYTGDIIYDKNNHINQYEYTSLSRLNQDQDRVLSKINNDVVFVGDESKRKGLDILLNALNRTQLNLDLTIIGIDNLDRYSKSEYDFNIECKGKIYDQELFYEKLSKNDALIMPSICEKQGKVQIEAMSAGVVPICSDSGGTYTTIDNYHTGLLFKEGSTNGLIRCLNELYNNPNIYRCLQKNGLDYTSKLSIENEVERMTSIIKNYYGIHKN